MSLLNDHKTNTRHLPLVQHLALAALLHFLIQMLCAMLAHFWMFAQLLLNQLMIDNGIAMYQLVTIRAEAHEIMGIVRAVHRGGHNVMQLHAVIIYFAAAIFTFAPPRGHIMLGAMPSEDQRNDYPVSGCMV